MPCCEKQNETCATCRYSESDGITCHSPLIRRNPPEDAEWAPRDADAIDTAVNKPHTP